jgi:hypothetical protein
MGCTPVAIVAINSVYCVIWEFWRKSKTHNTHLLPEPPEHGAQRTRPSVPVSLSVHLSASLFILLIHLCVWMYLCTCLFTYVGPHIHLSQYSVWLRTGQPGSRGSIPARGKGFLYPDSALRPTQPSARWLPWVVFPGVKRGRGSDADHSPPSSAEVKNE